jgi:F0F1-type ATP synthase assembly protein I
VLRPSEITNMSIERPTIDSLAETSTRDLAPLPDRSIVVRFLNTVLLLHITSSKQYSAQARAFLLEFSNDDLDETAATAILKDPKHALEDAEKYAQNAKDEQAKTNRVWRAVGVGSAAVVGGVLVGVTGGLAAPLVGAGVSSLLGILGLGGSAAGILAAGLAGSSAVCGALFGVYGAKSGAEMIARHTKEVADLAIVPVRDPKETLAVRICVSRHNINLTTGTERNSISVLQR